MKKQDKLKASSKFRILLLFVFLILSLSLFLFSDYLGYTAEAIQGAISGYNYLAVFIFIVLIGIASATTLPVSAATFPGILVFSFAYTIFYAIIGIVIAGIIVYYLSMYLGRDFILKYSDLKGGRLNTFNYLLKKDAFGFVVLLNFVYFFPSNLGHMVAGITDLKLSKFIPILVLGNFFNTFSVALFFLGILKANPTYIITAILTLTLASLVPMLIYRKHIKNVLIVAFGKKAYEEIKYTLEKLD